MTTLRHDLHLITCGCSVAEFQQHVTCGQVLEYARKTSVPSTCEECGERLMIRAVELVGGSPEDTLTPDVLFYRASLPIPITTWLAAVRPQDN